MRTRVVLWAVAGVVAALSLVQAEGRAGNTPLSGGATLIGLADDDDRSETELSASLDLYIDLAYGPGSLLIYVEGSSTPRENGVSILVPESNADAGTALNRDGDGRLQVSELKYTISLPGERTLAFGLLDPTAYLDTTRINNDENMQFLGTAFLNNPAIEFPDYTLGVVYHQDPSGRGPALSVALVGSEGLADNPDASYADLFDVADEGKGAFLGAEAGWQTRLQRYRLGAWIDTADHPRLDGTPGSENGYGLYTTIGRTRGRHAGNIRLGAADEDVSSVAGFASLTYQYSRGRQVLGLGAARGWSSADLAAATPFSTQFEAYLRMEPVADFFVTPSVQYVRDSGFSASGTSGLDNVFVYAVRLHYQL